MEVYGKVYRKGTESRWIYTSGMPEICNEIDIDAEDHQLSVAGKMMDWLEKLNLYEKALKTERFLANDMIFIVVEFTDKEGYLSKLILWGDPDRPLYRKGGMEFWSDVDNATKLPMLNER